MRRRYKQVLFGVAVTLFCSVSVHAQDVETDTGFSSVDTGVMYNYEASEYEEVQAREIIYNKATPTDAQWQRTTGEDAYRYRDKREFVRTAKDDAPEQTPALIRAIIRVLQFLRSGTGQLILWSAFILIVGFVAYRIIAGGGSSLFGRRDRKKPLPEDAGNITEEGLLESDWDAQLQAALSAGDTRLAVRYSYLSLLQSLQERGLIVYRQDKTNAAYARELTESMRPSFRTVSRQYEYTWYGNYLPEQSVMDTYMQTYTSLKKAITYA